MSKRTKLLWGIVFLLIFLLSQDYLFVHWEGKTSFLGLPNWIAWFVFVHLVFIATLSYFAKKHWK